MTSNNVVTRFPPSPTGMMHIGNARTALFNWLYARHMDGKFLIRIEDTDRARHTEEAVDVIKESLAWLSLNYDNEPESQYENRQRHIDVANEMVKNGQAYYCYCSPDELQEMRDKAKAEGRSASYDRRWRDRAPEDAPKDIKPVIRVKAPLEGQSVINDEVQGSVTVDNSTLDDLIILRSDGTPTYMLAVVVDDHDMGVTHVIRGDDHLNNTFRQNVIYDVLGWAQPTYAHLPLIHGADGAKLSKRHGAVSVQEFEQLGYLPEAVLNYLLRLGWGHGDQEFFSAEEAVKLFDLKAVNKSAAKFDYTKLESINAHYMKEADNTRLIELVAPFLQTEHDIEISETGLAHLTAGMDGLKDRSKTLVELASESVFYLIPADKITYNDKANKHLNTDAKSVLEGLVEVMQNTAPFTHDDIESACRDFANAHAGGKLGKVMMPLRAALTGTDKSPSLFEVVEILGKDEVCARIQKAIEHISR